MTGTDAKALLPLVVIDEATKVLGGPLYGRTKLTKLVFLLQSMRPKVVHDLIGSENAFRFEPFYYGPFSSDLLASLEKMGDDGLIRIGQRSLGSSGKIIEHVYITSPKGANLLAELEPAHSEIKEARRFLDRYVRMERSQLVDFVHDRFPGFVKDG